MAQHLIQAKMEDIIKPSDNVSGQQVADVDKDVQGEHYRHGGIEPIDYIEANGLNFSEGSIIKYATRHRYKGGAKDLYKVIYYAVRILQKIYGEEKGNIINFINNIK